MNDLIKMFRTIENDTQSIIADKRVDYLFHYWLGKYESESLDRGILFYSGLAEWIYQSLLNKGYQTKFSYCWYKMFYSVFDDEENAWNIFFECVYNYIEKCEKEKSINKMMERNKVIDVNKLVHLIANRPGIATGEKKVDYVTHYFAGIYAKEDENINNKIYNDITQWIYTGLKHEGHNIQYSKWWHKMIYDITTDEAEAWEILFQQLHKYFN